jgi:hypothetical protein
MNEEYQFHGQKEGEKVVEVVHNHPYILYPVGFRTVLLFCLALLIILFFPAFWYVAVPIVLFGFTIFFNAFYCYKESIFIVTNLRVFLIEQRGFFSRKISEVDLSKIIDMASETKGMTKTMLKYGDLVIRTAGANEGGDIVLKNISNPYEVQQRIAALEKFSWK